MFGFYLDQSEDFDTSACILFFYLKEQRYLMSK